MDNTQNNQNNQSQIEKTLKIAKIAEQSTVVDTSIMENKRRLAAKKMAAAMVVENQSSQKNAESVIPMAYIQSMAQPEKVDVKLQLRETAKDNDLRQKEQEKQNEEMEKQLEEPALAQARESNEQRLKEEIRRREAAGAGVFAGTLGGKKSHLIRNVAIAGGVIAATSITSLTAFPLFFGHS